MDEKTVRTGTGELVRQLARIRWSNGIGLLVIVLLCCIGGITAALATRERIHRTDEQARDMMRAVGELHTAAAGLRTAFDEETSWACAREAFNTETGEWNRTNCRRVPTPAFVPQAGEWVCPPTALDPLGRVFDRRQCHQLPAKPTPATTGSAPTQAPVRLTGKAPQSRLMLPASQPSMALGP